MLSGIDSRTGGKPAIRRAVLLGVFAVILLGIGAYPLSAQSRRPEQRESFMGVSIRQVSPVGLAVGRVLGDDNWMGSYVPPFVQIWFYESPINTQAYRRGVLEVFRVGNPLGSADAQREGDYQRYINRLDGLPSDPAELLAYARTLNLPSFGPYGLVRGGVFYQGRPRRLRFLNGYGISYLHYGGNGSYNLLAPDRTITYAFSGVTDDHRFVVDAGFSVEMPKLSAGPDLSDVCQGDPCVKLRAAINEARGSRLEAFSNADFIPNLDVIDGVIATLRIDPSALQVKRLAPPDGPGCTPALLEDLEEWSYIPFAKHVWDAGEYVYSRIPPAGSERFLSQPLFDVKGFELMRHGNLDHEFVVTLKGNDLSLAREQVTDWLHGLCLRDQLISNLHLHYQV